MRWEALMAAVLGKMTPATEMRFADGVARLSKTKLEPITMSVAVRSGNKKVCHRSRAVALLKACKKV